MLERWAVPSVEMNSLTLAFLKAWSTLVWRLVGGADRAGGVGVSQESALQSGAAPAVARQSINVNSAAAAFQSMEAVLGLASGLGAIIMAMRRQVKALGYFF